MSEFQRAIERIEEIRPSGTDGKWVEGAESFKTTALRELRLLAAGVSTPAAHSEPLMDRPAYELVRLIEAALDDSDQITDTPQEPNRISVWGIRMLLEPYGGKAHRWQWPLCFECKHQMPLHNYGPCDLCGCAITPEEIGDGQRDEALDEAIQQALRDERERRA